MKKILLLFITICQSVFSQSRFEDVVFGSDASTFEDMSQVLDANGVRYFSRNCEPLTKKYSYLKEVRYVFDNNNKLYMIKLFCREGMQAELYNIAKAQNIPWIKRIGNKDIWKDEITGMNLDVAGQYAGLSIFDIGMFKLAVNSQFVEQ